jgi:hypothetical protein
VDQLTQPKPLRNSPRFGFLAWIPLLVGPGWALNIGLSERQLWGYLGYSMEGFRAYPWLRLGIGLFGSIAALGLLCHKRWGLWASCLAGAACLMDAIFNFVANGRFMLWMVLNDFRSESMDVQVRHAISLLFDVGTLVSWPLLFVNILAREPFGFSARSGGDETTVRRGMFLASIVSISAFYVVRHDYR